MLGLPKDQAASNRIAEFLNAIGWEFVPLRDNEAGPADRAAIWMRSFSHDEILDQIDNAWINSPTTQVIAGMMGFKDIEQPVRRDTTEEVWPIYLSGFSELEPKRPIGSRHLCEILNRPYETVKYEIRALKNAGLLRKWGTGQMSRWYPAKWKVVEPRVPPLVIAQIEPPYALHDEVLAFIEPYNEVKGFQLRQRFGPDVPYASIDPIMVHEGWRRRTTPKGGSVTTWFRKEHPLWDATPHALDRAYTLPGITVPKKRKLTAREKKLVEPEIEIEDPSHPGLLLSVPLQHELKRLREHRSWSQKDAAEHMGIHKKTIWRFETGNRASIMPSMLKVLAHGYGVSVEHLKSLSLSFEANKVLEVLHKPKTAKTVAKESGLSEKAVRSYIGQLGSRGLVKKMGNVYVSLT